MEALNNHGRNFNTDEAVLVISPKQGKGLIIKYEKDVFEVSGLNYKANKDSILNLFNVSKVTSSKNLCFIGMVMRCAILSETCK